MLLRHLGLTAIAASLLSGCISVHKKAQPAPVVLQDPPPILSRHYTDDFQPDWGYAQATQVGRTVYVSGMVAGGETMEQQVQGVYQRLQGFLANIGADMSDVAKETVFTTDIEALKGAKDVRKSFFPANHYPASSWIQIERLFSEGAMVEIEFVIVLKN